VRQRAGGGRIVAQAEPARDQREPRAERPALALDITVPLRHFALEAALRIGEETLALVGPSGAGKTTILRAIAGLMKPSRGEVRLGEHVWFSSSARVDLSPDLRSVGLVFQDYALFPHMTVRKNIEYGRKGRSDELMERFRISHLANARPGQLSGGERQRVALARAIAREPGVLLLDEPLAALDAHTKQTVRSELRDLLVDAGLPTLIVTHDFEDAASLASRVGVIVEGHVRQDASPEELVASPADEFVAHLTGANVLRGVAEPGGSGLTVVTLEDGTRIYSTDLAEGPVSVAIYPWEVSLGRGEPDKSAMNHLRAPVRSTVTIGNRVRVRLGLVTAEITKASAERFGVAEGELLTASFKATATRLIGTTE
jgi:molybdate transport system ATP-binding protein